MTQAEYSQTRPTNQALPMFWQAVQRGWLYRFWAHLTRRPVSLLELDQTLCCAVVQNSSYGGTRPVEIGKIRGTQSKGEEFDAEFNPLKEASRSRWLSVAKQRLSGNDLPPVDLVEVEGIYYVRDGHHRISVARSLGQAFIDAEIVHMHLTHRVM